MPTLGGGSLTAARTQPVGRRWTLYVYQPVTLWTGTVGGSPSRGDRSLTVSTVSGDPADMFADSTIWVRDSSDNLKDYPSKVRMRTYAANTLGIADNNIDWASGDKLYAKRLVEIWPRTVFIDGGGVQYKDRDVTYTDDATTQAPVANGGVAAIGTLSGGICDIVFKDEGSFAVPLGGAVTSYLWDALGGSPTVQAGAEASSTVTYRYATAGDYLVSYTVTDANGKTEITYIPVIVDDGTKGYSLEADARQWSHPGWTMDRSLLGLDADETVLFDGAPLFLMADSQATPTDAFVDNRSALRWSGWLIADETSWNYYGRRIRYNAVSSAHILATIPAYPIGLRLDAAANEWYELISANIDSMAVYLLRWHSTLLTCVPYVPTGEWNTRNRPGENLREQSSLLAQINYILRAVFAELRCDRQGVVRARRNPWYMSTAEKAALDTVMTLTAADILEVTYGPKPHRARVREVRALGVDGASAAYMSGAPGDAPLDGGAPGEVTQLAPVSQAELNQWAAQHLSNENWSVSLRVRMAGEFDVFEPAWKEFVAGTLSSIDSKLPDGPYTVESVRFQDNQAKGYTLSEIDLLPDPAAYGAYAGETRDIPVDPDPPDPPPFPDDFPDPLPDPVTVPDEVYFCAKGTATFVYHTTDFSAANPTWTALTATGLPGGYDLYQFQYDRANPADDRIFVIDQNAKALYRSEGAAAWTKSMDTADAATITSVAAGAGARIEFCAVDKVTGRVWAMYRKDDSDRILLLYSDANGDAHPAAWSWVEVSSVHKYYTTSPAYIRARNGNLLMFAHRLPPSAGGIGDAGHNMYYSADAGSSWGATDIHFTTTTYAAGGVLDPFTASKGYAKKRSSASLFDLVEVDATDANVIDDVLDLNPGPDRFWGSLITSGMIRGVRPGSKDNFYAVLFATDDSFATSPDKLTLPYYNIDSMAWITHDETDDFIIFGCTDCNDGSAGMTEHHILFADDAIDPTAVAGKAGANAGTSPYTDAIPETAGGSAVDGIQVVL